VDIGQELWQYIEKSVKTIIIVINVKGVIIIQYIFCAVEQLLYASVPVRGERCPREELPGMSHAQKSD
jgi:hypothetical protein